MRHENIYDKCVLRVDKLCTKYIFVEYYHNLLISKKAIIIDY